MCGLACDQMLMFQKSTLQLEPINTLLEITERRPVTEISLETKLSSDPSGSFSVAANVATINKFSTLNIICMLWVNRKNPHLQMSEAFGDC